MRRTLFFALLALATTAGADSTFSYPTQPLPTLRVSKLVATTGTEAVPAFPAKAKETVTIADLAPGDILMITGAGKVTTLTAHASKNSGTYFKIEETDADTAANLAAAVNRQPLSVGASAVNATVTVEAKEVGAEANGIALNYAGAIGAWTCGGDCSLAGGISPVGLDLTRVHTFTVYACAAAGGTVSDGSSLSVYYYLPGVPDYVYGGTLTVEQGARCGYAKGDSPGYGIPALFSAGRVFVVPTGMATTPAGNLDIFVTGQF